MSYVKLVVSDLHVCLKTEEIHILVILWMNHEFMEYMRTSYLEGPTSPRIVTVKQHIKEYVDVTHCTVNT